MCRSCGDQQGWRAVGSKKRIGQPRSGAKRGPNAAIDCATDRGRSGKGYSGAALSKGGCKPLLAESVIDVTESLFGNSQLPTIHATISFSLAYLLAEPTHCTPKALTICCGSLSLVSSVYPYGQISTGVANAEPIVAYPGQEVPPQRARTVNGARCALDICPSDRLNSWRCGRISRLALARL